MFIYSKKQKLKCQIISKDKLMFNNQTLTTYSLVKGKVKKTRILTKCAMPTLAV